MGELEAAKEELRRVSLELEQERAERQRLQQQLDAHSLLAAESRERGEKLLARGQALERSNRDLTSFTAIASHDLQEPLRKIRTFIDRLRSRSAGSLDAEAQQLLERIFDASQRMQQLIEDLLAYAQLERTDLRRTELDLTAVAHEVLADLSLQIEKSGARVEVSPLPRLTVQPTQIRQLFQNLISNALKFVRPGVPPTIRISAQQAGDGWELLFEDNGLGFEPRHAERIFGMFQRLHSRSEFPGSGMGLAIVRRIAERHGGTVSAQSVPEHGSTFRIRLPALQREA